MMKFILVIVVAAVAVGGYIALTPSEDRGQIGDPVLSVSPSQTPSESSAPVVLVDGTYQLIASSSQMSWEGRKTLILNYTDKGSVGLKSGTAVVSGGKVARGEVVVDMTTIKTSSTGRGSGESMQERHIKGADFFDVEKYPTATFTFDSISTASASGDLTVNGKLTIKGVTQPIVFLAKLLSSGDQLIMQATVTLNRTHWGIKYGSGSFFKDLGDNVIDDMFTVSFSVVGKLSK
jgi:polyisoprenoid-binding protein YceI